MKGAGAGAKWEKNASPAQLNTPRLSQRLSRGTAKICLITTRIKVMSDRERGNEHFRRSHQRIFCGIMNGLLG